MRKLFLSLAAAAVTMAAAALSPSNANAAVVAPSAMQPAVVDSNVVDNVAWIERCHHHWRSSNRHCRTVWVPRHRHHHHHHHHHHRHHHHRRHHH
jgi:hypothetical protein